MTEFQLQTKQLQKVYEEWCVKAGELILHSRVHPDVSKSSKTSATFGIATPEALGVRSVLDAQTFFSTSHGLVIDILNPDIEKKTVRVIERWRFSFLPPQGDMSEQKNRTLMRKLCVGIRSLLCYTRLLPGYGIFRMSLLGKSSLQAKAKSSLQSHTIRMGSEDKFEGNPIPNAKHEDFLILPSSLGSLRLRVSHVMLPNGCQPLVDVAKQPRLIDAIQFEEGYVEKEFDDRDFMKTRLGSDAATSICSTTPEATIVFRPAGTPPFGHSVASNRFAYDEPVFRSSNQSCSSPGTPKSTPAASFPPTPRTVRPVYPDLQDIWVDRKRDMSPPRRQTHSGTESSESAEICIFGLDSDNEEEHTGSAQGFVSRPTSAPSVMDELNPFPSASVSSSLSRTVFALDSSAAFDLGNDCSWET